MKALKFILVLSILGFLLSGYMTSLHFKPEKLDSSFCNIDDYFSCSTVNKSSYSTFLGIPVAIMGMIGFALLGFLSLGKIKYHKVGIFYSSLLGVGFMAYLTGAEIFFIKAVCVLCVIAALIISLVFLAAAISFGKESVRFVKEIEFE